MGSCVGRGNQYTQLVKVLYCKLPTISKKLRTVSNKVRGLNCRPQKWEVSVLPLPQSPDRILAVEMGIKLETVTLRGKKCFWSRACRSNKKVKTYTCQWLLQNSYLVKILHFSINFSFMFRWSSLNVIVFSLFFWGGGGEVRESGIKIVKT